MRLSSITAVQGVRGQKIRYGLSRVRPSGKCHKGGCHVPPRNYSLRREYILLGWAGLRPIERGKVWASVASTEKPRRLHWLRPDKTVQWNVFTQRTGGIPAWTTRVGTLPLWQCDVLAILDMERLLLTIHLVPRISRTAALIFPAEMKNCENLLNPLLPFGNMETIAKVNVRKHSSFALEPSCRDSLRLGLFPLGAKTMP